MKNSTRRSFFLFPFIFLIHLSTNIAQTPWVKEKVRVKAHVYAENGMDILKYNWQDSEMNSMLGRVEKFRIRKKAFFITGGVGAGVSALLWIYNSDGTYNCPTDLPNYENCLRAKQETKNVAVLATLNSVVSVGFLIGGQFEYKKEQEQMLLVKKRYQTLGL